MIPGASLAVVVESGSPSNAFVVLPIVIGRLAAHGLVISVACARYIGTSRIAANMLITGATIPASRRTKRRASTCFKMLLEPKHLICF